MLENLAQLVNGVAQTLAEKVPGMATISAFPDIGRRIKLPAILIDIDQLEPDDDPGTGELALQATIQAFVVVDPTAGNAQALVKDLAARVAVAGMNENWHVPATPAKLIQIGDASFRPELNGYEVWLVEWTNNIRLGSEIDWQTYADPASKRVFDSLEGLAGEGIYPVREVVFGIWPDVGPGHEPDYMPLGAILNEQ